MVSPVKELSLALALAPAILVGTYILYHMLDPPHTRYYAPELAEALFGEKK